MAQEGGLDAAAVTRKASAKEMVEDGDWVAGRVPSAREHGGSHLRFENIHVVVEEKEPKMMGLVQKKTGREKTLLNKVSGYAEPGEVLFVMGASGSGKSTLLDAVSSRLGLPVQGNVYVDHAQVDAYRLKEIARYVQQDDSLYASLTVFETLMFCATLCFKEPHDRLVQRVEDVMTVLGLAEQRDTKVGGVFFRGLSGGQKRRLSVACELIAQPGILFLDEPTTGLDAAAAYYIVKSFRNIASAFGVTVIATIHSPSELVFEMADKLLLLSKGRTAYYGLVSEAREHMISLGLTPMENTATAEWLLRITNTDFDEKTAATAERICSEWPNTRACSILNNQIQLFDREFGSKGQGGSGSDALMSSYNVSGVKATLKMDTKFRVGWVSQFTTLVRRGFLTVFRDPAFVWLRFVMYFMLGLFIGLVWLQLGDNVAIVRDLLGGIFYIVAFFVFMGVAAIPAYIEERHVCTRERANGYYSVSAMFTAKVIVDLPFQFVLALGPGAVAYWLIGMQADAGKFFIYIALLFLTLFAGESFMLLLGAATDYALLGLLAGAANYGMFMITLGYLVNFNTLGWWWQWTKFINWEYYAYSAMVVNEVDGRVFSAGVQWGQPSPALSGDDILAFYNFSGVRIWVNAVALIAISVVLRVVTALYTHFFITGRKRA
ncbi:ABC transporter G family member 15 [Porphyridium purpureum]|uniref:Probable ATP-dependent transporter ycf16 n=1 Tax=Porphyridium purpureum TaxID=35688 RepID=A0A5J4YRY2_PORPP|nr:ABC transporter G family member 15 [Porphyridium purpureum]|eukprot:POR2248..scf296_7